MEKMTDKTAEVLPNKFQYNISNIMQKGLVFGILIILVLIFGILTGGTFVTVNNLFTVGLQVVPYAMIGFGLTFVIITGGNDISVGSVMGLGGIVTATFLTMGYNLYLSIFLGMIAGAFAGLFNGFCVTKLGVTPFIVTLGTQFAFRGLTQLIGGGKPVSVQAMENKEVVDLFKYIGGGTIFGVIPVPLVIMGLLAIVLGILLAKTSYGRSLYAVGSNEEAAKLSGINVTKVKLIAYLISGMTASLAGILLAARLASAQSNAGQGYEMEGIAAAVIGGTSVMGGTGTILGTVIGAFVMGTVKNGLNLLRVDPFVQMIVTGLIIIGGVWYDNIRRQKQNL